MRTLALILFFALSARSALLPAQAPAPKEPPACPVSLPYVDGQLPDCTAQSAAAYDFAFCSVSYHIISLAAPESDKALGEKSQSASYRRRGTDYAMVSAALSNAETLQKNVALTQKFYESLNGKENVYIRLTLDTIGLKCDGLEGHHSATLDELGRTTKARPKAGG
jgi:hypothetical protein